jgi:hypothetical protein
MEDAQLNTYELRAIMKDEPNFLGVFAIDRLPRNLEMSKTIKMIVNLDPAHQPGSHWVAIYRRNKKAFYFDSFGNEPPTTVRNWLNDNSISWTRHAKRIQSPQDKVSCGYLCVEFLKKL